MKPMYVVLGLVLACAMGCASLKNPLAKEKDKEIPLSQVPEQALEAARGAVDGITLTEAEVEKEGGRTIYVVEGTANGIEYDIEVTADGKVLGIEKEDADDDEGDDEDDDED